MRIIAITLVLFITLPLSAAPQQKQQTTFQKYKTAIIGAGLAAVALAGAIAGGIGLYNAPTYKLQRKFDQENIILSKDTINIHYGPDQDTPLIMSIKKDYPVEYSRIICENYNPDMNQTDLAGNTALMVAVTKIKPFVEAFIASPSNLNAKNAYNSYLSFLTLLAKGTDKSLTNSAGKTAYQIANDELPDSSLKMYVLDLLTLYTSMPS